MIDEEKTIEEKPVKNVIKKEMYDELIDEEDDEEGESKFVTVLNYAIVALMLVFVGLICFIIKDILF